MPPGSRATRGAHSICVQHAAIGAQHAAATKAAGDQCCRRSLAHHARLLNAVCRMPQAAMPHGVCDGLSGLNASTMLTACSILYGVCCRRRPWGWKMCKLFWTTKHGHCLRKRTTKALACACPLLDACCLLPARSSSCPALMRCVLPQGLVPALTSPGVH